MRNCIVMAAGILLIAGNGYAAPLVNSARTIIPHEAIYNVDLATKKADGQVLDISGTMQFSWILECGAWITNHHTDIVYTYTDGTSLPMKTSFSSYEALDGGHFTFASQRRQNNMPVEEFKGTASLSGVSGGSATYSLPEDSDKVTLPAGTFFPMHHTMVILDKAKQGEKFFYAPLFDGSDSMAHQYVSAFIGKENTDVDIASPDENVDEQLLKARSWPLNLAFYGDDAAEGGLPSYEMELTVLDNGVVTNALIDYGQFSLRQELKSLKPLEVPVCD